MRASRPPLLRPIVVLAALACSSASPPRPMPEPDAAMEATPDAARPPIASPDTGAAEADRSLPDATPDATAPDLGADAPPAASACGAALAVPAEGAHEIPVAGEARKFLLRLPAAYDGKKPWPVLFIFHGAGQSASYFDGNTDLRAQTEEKAVLVFPDGPVKPDGRRSWVYRSPDNVLFVDALVQWLKANLCIDPSHLFATGLSSGGYMSVTLACQRGDVFRAVATCSGGMVEHENCRGNPTVWLRTGQADQQGTIDSVMMARDFWLDRNGCSRDKPQPLAGIPCVRYGGCVAGGVVFCTDPGGHGWPGYFSKAIWSEFSAL